MKITEIVVSRSCTRNLTNYENTNVFCSMKLELESVDLEEFCEKDIASLQDRVREVVLDEMVKIVHSKPEHAAVTKEAIARRYGL